MTTKTSNKLLHVYFGLVSLLSFVGVVICLGIVANVTLNKLLITDAEYLEREMRWEKDQCMYDYQAPVQPEGKTKMRTVSEQETCLSEKRDAALLSRSYEFKETMIGGVTR